MRKKANETWLVLAIPTEIQRYLRGTCGSEGWEASALVSALLQIMQQKPVVLEDVRGMIADRKAKKKRVTKIVASSSSSG